jgi:hypothetical protein
MTQKTSTPPPPRKRPRDLSTEQACRRALAAWIADVESGALDPKRANSIFYGASILIGSFRDERLEEIAKQLAEIRQMGAGQ